MDNHAYHPDDDRPFAITRYPSDYLVEVHTKSKFLKNSKFYKRCTVVLLILVILLFIAVIVLLALYGDKYSPNRICTTDECLRSAANLRLSIDFSTDPCENFYQYTCGRWSVEHPNHGWFSSFSTFHTINEKLLIETETFLNLPVDPDEPLPVRQAKDLYRSCMDTDSIDKLGFSVLFKYLKEVGLPEVPSLFTKTEDEIAAFTFDWLRMDAMLKKQFGMDVFIGFAVDANMFNRSENVMLMGVPFQSCPLPSPLKKTKHEQDLTDLKTTINSNIIKHVITAIMKNMSMEAPKEDTLLQATEVLLNMTTHVEELISNYTQQSETMYPLNIKEFQAKVNEILNSTVQKQYPQIWEKYFTYLFSDLNITIDFDKEVFYTEAPDEAYLPKILGYILTTSDIYLELYMWWVTVFAMIINTTSELAEYIAKQTAPFYGNAVTRSRSLDCCVLVNTFMGMAVSYGLADTSFPNKTKPKVEQMLYDIKDAFTEQVNSLNWMDKETKRATLEKTKEMMSFIGYPDWLFKKGALEAYYEGGVVNNDTFLENMMNFIGKVIPGQLESLRKYHGRNWSAEPTDVNAYNSFPDNSINVPMAILTFPVYNLGLEVLNYGAIGSVLGHELTHGFDNTGRKYDKFGNYKEWWTNTTIQTFEDKIECFIKQYDNFTFDGISDHVQGKQTLGENLADNGGLSHAYRAYHNYRKRHRSEPRLPGFEHFTHEQLFFLAFASIWCQTINQNDLEVNILTDEHSPNAVRVVGTLQNFPEFSRAFHCPVGSGMNPNRNKCKVW